MKNKTDLGLFPNSLKRGLAHMSILFLKIRGQTMPFIIKKKKHRQYTSYAIPDFSDHLVIEKLG